MSDNVGTAMSFSPTHVIIDTKDTKNQSLTTNVEVHALRSRKEVIKRLRELERINGHPPKQETGEIIDQLEHRDLTRYGGLKVNPLKGKSHRLETKCPQLAVAKCELCDYRSSKDGVLRHKQRFHPKETFHCEICGRMFGLRYDMRRHRMNHFTAEGVLTAKGRAFYAATHSNLDPHSIRLEQFEDNFKKPKRSQTRIAQEKEQKRGVKDTAANPADPVNALVAVVTLSSTDIHDTNISSEASSPINQDEALSQTDNDDGETNPKERNKSCKNPPRDTAREVCQVCGKEFARKSMAVHMRSHQQEIHHCEVIGCDFTASRLGQLKKHVRLKHIRLWNCTECGKNFHTRSTLEQHHDAVHGQNVTCEVCNKSLSTARYLAIHMRREHEHIKLHYCPTCNKGFFQRNQMLVHSLMHISEDAKEKVKMYECAHCPKRFLRRNLLRQHENSHTGERPYKCTQCPRSFFNSAQLHKHKRVHSDAWRHECKVCHRAFKFPYKLAQHMITHTKDPKHRCADCGKHYTSATTLLKHSCQAVIKGVRITNPVISQVVLNDPITGQVLEESPEDQSCFDLMKQHSVISEQPVIYMNSNSRVQDNIAVNTTDQSSIYIKSEPLQKTSLFLNPENNDNSTLYIDGDNIDSHLVVLNTEPPVEQVESGTSFMCGCCKALFDSVDEINSHILTHEQEHSPEAEFVSMNVVDFKEENVA